MDNFNEKEFLRAVGERLRIYRVINKMSQEKASELIGISQTQYSTIERGEAKTSIVTLYKILYAFDGLSGDYLISNDKYAQEECINILKNILNVCPKEKIELLKMHLLFAENAIKF